MRLFLLAAAVTATVASLHTQEGASQANFLSHAHLRAYYEDRFLDWMNDYGLSIPNHEYESRLLHFANAEDMIAKHNADDKATFTMGHNMYSHMSWPEFKASKGIGRPLQSSLDTSKPRYHSATAVSRRRLAHSLPKNWNWHEKGAVTGVSNQGSCGSCWSFSSTGAIEGAYFIKKGNLVSLSEQMLVDCDIYNSGCGGGLMDISFYWIQENGGICAEDDYPYTASNGACAASSCSLVPGTSIDYWIDVQPTEEALMAAVYQQPVSVAIEADEPAFQFYKDGVLTAGCGTSLDHGALLTGYGSTSEGIDYWMVKNSWGEEWGSSGYVKLLRGTPQFGGQCGILMRASYPVLV